MRELPHQAQRTLAFPLRDHASFDNFISASNEELIRHLQGAGDAEGPMVAYLWGRRGTGKTHLLQALCREVMGDAGRVAYIPLGAEQLRPAMLESLEDLSLVCIDNLDVVAGDGAWEEAIFHLYNRVLQSRTRLVVTAGTAPAGLKIALPDLHSRLAGGLVFQVRELSERDRIRAMQQRARQRGFELPGEVARYLISRFPRDTHSLFHLLDLIDRGTLAAQRRATVPFIRKLLDAG